MDLELEIICPNNCISERKYIVDLVFGSFFPVAYKLHFRNSEEGGFWQIHNLRTGLKVIFPDVFFAKCNELGWLHPETLPSYNPQEIEWLESPDRSSFIFFEKTPIPFSDPNLESEDPYVCIGDLFGSMFFMISRYEECVIAARDAHARFTAAHSWMGALDVVKRAIVNEWLELLLNRLGLRSGLNAVPGFKFLACHDIDFPSLYRNRSVKALIKCLAYGVLERKRLNVGMQVVESLSYPVRGWTNDPYDTIKWIAELNRSHSIESCFHYIPVRTKSVFDPYDSFDTEQVESQFETIIQNGHQICLHPGYNSYKSSALIKQSVDVFRAKMEPLLGEFELISRQHYLRWEQETTPKLLSQNGVSIDATLGFSDSPGFRGGTCYEFQIYDLLEREPLDIVERPLVAMEHSVMSNLYGGVKDHAVAFGVFSDLVNECRKYGGGFTLLWHNTMLIREEDRDLYCEILKTSSSGNGLLL